MTPTQLRNKLKGVTKAQIVTIEYFKELRSPKGIYKYQRTQGIINARYDVKMAKELGMDSYTPGQRPWGVRVEDSPLIEHKGTYYLELYPLRELEVAYTDEEGRPVQHTEKVRENVIVAVKDFNLDNIRSLSMGGERYDLQVSGS